MPHDPLAVAVIGCGSTAHRRHLPVWKGLAGARLAAVCSRNPERRGQALEQYGASRAVADWRELVESPEITAVDICTPHPQHAEIACAFLRAGKHVLCEKPLATSVAQAESMVAAAAASGAVLMPFHNMRLAAAPSRAISLVHSGAVGRPLLVRGVMAHGGPDARDPARRWFLEASAGGGALLDLGPHLFDLVAALVGEPARRLRATVVRAPQLSVERDGLVEVEFRSGAIAQLTASWSMTAARETALVVQGERGTLRMCLLQTPPPAQDSVPAPLVLSVAGGGEEYPNPGPGDEPCAAFVRAIAGEPAAITAADGLRAVRWVDAAYRSEAADGAWVDV